MSLEVVLEASPVEIATAISRLLAGVPHCPPLPLAEIAAALDGPRCCRAAERLSESKVWLCREGDAVTGVAHAAIEAATDETPRRGVIRFLAYERGHRAAGQVLLERAERLTWDAGAEALIAWHYDHTYPWYHAEHVCLSGTLDHVHALFGANGYARVNGQLVLDWPDYAFVLREAPVPLTLEWRWAGRPSGGDELELLARQGDRQVGICVCIGQGAFQAAPQAQDWVYVRWLHVAEDLRGQGLGRYLVQAALDGYRQRGYRHAVI
ncbi:MAG: GNAT family N-acetyltransferase, partial [Anaerolineae bacterium]